MADTKATPKASEVTAQTGTTGALKGVTPKYRWTPAASKGSTASVRLTASGKAAGVNAKKAKPGSKTLARWQAFLAALDKAGGSLPVGKAREYQTGADLAWEYQRGRIEYLDEAGKVIPPPTK